MKRTRTETSWLVALGLAASTWLMAAPLRAEPAHDRGQARAHFDRGVALGKERAYQDALTEFRLAYDAFPNYGVLYNIAQALILLERPSEAIISLESYLNEGGAQIDAKRRAEVEATLARQREKTGALDVHVEPPGAHISVDDQSVGPSPLAAPLRVDPGRHRVRATSSEGISRETTLEVAAQQVVSVRLDLAPPPAPAPPVPAAAASPLPIPAPPRGVPAPPPVVPAPTRAHSTQRTLGYVLGAAGVVLSGVAIGHYFWNRGRYQDWQARASDYQREPTDENREAANHLARAVPAASAVTVGLFAGAGVALGTGAVLIITASPVTEPSATRATGALLQFRGEL